MCKAHRPSLCEASGTPGIGMEHGAFATYKLAPAAQVLPMPEGLDPRAAALAEPLSVALHGIHQGRTHPGDRVLVLGAGPIGALSIAALRAIGVDDVRCAEPSPTRQALAAAVGATRVLHPEELEVPNMAEPMRMVDDAVDVVLECSGKAKAMEAGLAQLGEGRHPRAGRRRHRAGPASTRTGSCSTSWSSPAPTPTTTTASSRPSRCSRPAGSPIEHLVETEEVPLDGVLDAMRGLAEGRTAGKVLVRP